MGAQEERVRRGHQGVQRLAGEPPAAPDGDATNPGWCDARAQEVRGQPVLSAAKRLEAFRLTPSDQLFSLFPKGSTIDVTSRRPRARASCPVQGQVTLFFVLHVRSPHPFSSCAVCDSLDSTVSSVQAGWEFYSKP